MAVSNFSRSFQTSVLSALPVVIGLALLLPTIAGGCSDATLLIETCRTDEECPDGVCIDNTCVASDVAHDSNPGDVPTISDSGDGVAQSDADAGEAGSGGSDSFSRADASPGTFGAPCDEPADCASGYCVRDPDADGGFCTTTCRDACPDDRLRCERVTESEGDVVSLCVPPSDSLCEPCESDADCSPDGSVCADVERGRSCLSPCDLAGNCPAEFSCEEFSGGGAARPVCRPDSDSCIDCVDGDGDGYGVGTACIGSDCDDGNGDVRPNASEICDGIDNDCDGLIDEETDIADDPENCGRCGNVCSFDNATARCADGTCVLDSCREGFADCDGRVDNGCETDLGDSVCGTCASAGIGPAGGECGSCGSGSWGCDPDGRPICEGDLGDDAYDICGNCRTELSCTPGNEERGASCGSCGVQVRSCQDDCLWGEWSCMEGAACAAGATEEETRSCGGCGEGVQRRTRSCRADGCGFGEWTAWSACETDAECAGGAVEEDRRACGDCEAGTQTRTRRCSSDTCRWDEWSSWTSCDIDTVCSPGETERQTRDCGNCNLGSQQRTRTCSSSTCSWGSWSSWTGCSGGGACSPGATRDGSCGRCLEQRCTSRCEWSGCQLRSGAACDWQEGRNWRCCASGRWQFCLGSCVWSTDCAPCSGCGC